MGKWKSWLEKKGLAKIFKRDNLIILILSGVLLFIIALPTEDAQSPNQGQQKSGQLKSEQLKTDEQSQSSGAAVQDEGSLSGQDTYTAYLEEKLRQTLSEMAGVGKVEVMLTLESSEEIVVEKDEPENRSTTTERDAEGGSRIVNQMEITESTVYRTQGSDSEPYVVKTLLPRVEGVVVVAEGAGSGTVSRSITEVVQALFGLEAHKVRVVKMGS